MDATDTAISFFTSLTVLADLTVVGLVLLALARRWSRWSQGVWEGSVRPRLVDGGPTVAWLVAVVCTAGSLWFSEVAGFVPCRLCWVQRACMYPLVIVLGVAAVASARPRRWGRVAAGARAPGLALCAVGAAVATYHVLLERYPSLETGACDPDNPCSLVWFRELGFVTLPFMALSGFALIATLLLAGRPDRSGRPDHPGRPGRPVLTLVPAPGVAADAPTDADRPPARLEPLP